MCDHSWEINGWTSIKCSKCGKRKDDGGKLLSEKGKRMYSDNPKLLTEFELGLALRIGK